MEKRMMLAILLALVLACATSAAMAGSKVICSDAGAGGYQAFPDVARLANGDLMTVFYAGYGHVSVPNKDLPRGGRIVSMRSTDDGKTWSKPVVVIDTPLDDRDSHITQLADGSVMVSFFTLRETSYANTYVVSSRDGGKSWNRMPILVTRHFACSAPVRQLRDGTLILGVYGASVPKSKSKTASGVVRSADNGKTWSEPIMITNTSGHSHDETDVTQLPSGQLLAFMRPCMCSSTSDDGGLTWSDAKPVGFPGHAPCFLRTSKGILIVGHRVPNTSLHYSSDDGKTWKGPVQLDHFGGAYPGFCELSDGRILCVYYEEGARSAIRQVTFRVNKSGVILDK